MNGLSKSELERIAGLAHAGAVRAAAAFAQLVGVPVEAERPTIRATAEYREDGGAAVDDPGSIGVFFEFDGCLDALVGILFPAGGGDRLVRSIVGIERGPLDSAIVESALMEVGNILASHVASGIADAMSSRLLPSIPALAEQRADTAFSAWIEATLGLDATRIESLLVADPGTTVGRLVVVPRAPAGRSARTAHD